MRPAGRRGRFGLCLGGWRGPVAGVMVVYGPPITHLPPPAVGASPDAAIHDFKGSCRRAVLITLSRPSRHTYGMGRKTRAGLPCPLHAGHGLSVREGSVRVVLPVLGLGEQSHPCSPPSPSPGLRMLISHERRAWPRTHRLRSQDPRKAPPPLDRVARTNRPLLSDSFAYHPL